MFLIAGSGRGGGGGIFGSTAVGFEDVVKEYISPGSIPAESVMVEYTVDAPADLPANVPIERIIKKSLADDKIEFPSDAAQRVFQQLVDSKVSQALIKVE